MEQDSEEYMLQIQDTLVSLDVVERFFICDLKKCKGECCIEGDAGAPISQEEFEKIQELLPLIWDDLDPKAQEKITREGVGYIDEEGDLVTTIINGKDCAFTYYDQNGMCLCAIEKAYRAGKTPFMKPISCHLYPVRIKEYSKFTAVNYHDWNICKASEILGRRNNVRVYQFLREPLIRRFGTDWYNELSATCDAYIAEYGK